jgi:hypothetical protein
VQAALVRTAQAKVGTPGPARTVAPHVQAALASPQAKVSPRSPGPRPPAPHVQAALCAVRDPRAQAHGSVAVQPKRHNAPPPTKLGMPGMPAPFSSHSVQMAESAGKRNPAVNYTNQLAANWFYKPQPNPDYNIPQRAMESIFEEHKNDQLFVKVSSLTSRTDFPSNHTQGMIDFLGHRDEKYLTVEDMVMIEEPSRSLKQEGISRNHKLADSSIRAIVVGIWAFLKDHKTKGTKPTMNDLGLLEDFFEALQPDDADPRDILKYLDDATEETSPYKIIRYLSSGIEKLSIDYKNLRFGNATTNEEVVYSFDPNVHADGSLTPLSERILNAGKRLAGILPKQAIESAFTMATSKTTGKPVTSSLTLF